MDNLYHSLYDDDDVFLNIGLDVIEKISGHRDPNSLSGYYNFEDYVSTITTLKNSYLNIIHINIRSIHKNFDVLKSVLNGLPKPPDVIAVTETWLQEHTKHLYSLEGYNSYHLVRTEREHGGVSIFINNMLQTELLNQFCFINEHIEILTCQLTIGISKYVIAAIYRPNSKHIGVNEFTYFINDMLNNEIFRENKSLCYGVIVEDEAMLEESLVEDLKSGLL